MKTSVHLLKFFALLMLIVPISALATIIEREVSVGGKISVSAKFKSGGSGTIKITDGEHGDKDPRPGFVKYDFPFNENEAYDVETKVLDVPAAQGAIEFLMLDDFSLTSFLPIDFYHIFSDSSDIILLSLIDLPIYSLHDSLFTEGQNLTILNGELAGSSGINFYDATSLYGNTDTFIDNYLDLSLATITGLTAYSGTATVSSTSRFRLVTSPSSILLLIFGVFVFNLKSRNK